jgi:hypothetical protein
MVQTELRNFLNDFGKDFRNGMMDGETIESHQKEFLKLKYFSPFKILTSPFICRDPQSFLFFIFFSLFFSLLFFHALSLEGLGVLMIFEEKIISSKTSFQMASIYWRWTYILEWSYACQHG